MTQREVPVKRFQHFFSQKDVRSDPIAVQEVSAATNNLLENLGALAVEVYGTRAHRKLSKSALLFVSNVQSSVTELWFVDQIDVYQEFSPYSVTSLPFGYFFFFF